MTAPSLPATMTVVEITSPGAAEVLQPRSRALPHPREGEVLIEVTAAGVNRPDLSQRLGKYPPPPGASDVPGLEVAGTIVEAGEGVGEWHVGAAVCALVAGGGYATHCVAPAAQCLPVPKGCSLIEAAAIPETFFTVWTNVFDRGGLRAGETILVHGGASGIGTTAIQLARAFGAAVFATAGSAEKCSACQRLGAARAINYREEDFVAVVKAQTDGRGVDLVLDMVGGEYVRRNFEALAPNGRLIQIAYLKGGRAEIDLGLLMKKRITFTGSTLRPRTVAEKGAIASALRQHVWPLIDKGAVRPVIFATFPLDQAAEAHRALEKGDHIGKIVLTTTEG